MNLLEVLGALLVLFVALPMLYATVSIFGYAWVTIYWDVRDYLRAVRR